METRRESSGRFVQIAGVLVTVAGLIVALLSFSQSLSDLELVSSSNATRTSINATQTSISLTADYEGEPPASGGFPLVPTRTPTPNLVSTIEQLQTQIESEIESRQELENQVLQLEEEVQGNSFFDNFNSFALAIVGLLTLSAGTYWRYREEKRYRLDHELNRERAELEIAKLRKELEDKEE